MDINSNDLKKCFAIKYYILLFEYTCSHNTYDTMLDKYKILVNSKGEIDSKIEEFLKSFNFDNIEYQLQTLRIIGKLLEEISWDTQEMNHIRNKHGQFGRYNDKKSKIPSGAKLNFEILAYLADCQNDINRVLFCDPLNFAVILKNNMRNDLRILREKLDFITNDNTLIDEQHSFNSELEKLKKLQANFDSEIDTNSERKKLSSIKHEEMPHFLINLASFCHDRICIKRMIELISLFDRNHAKLIDSKKVVHKYFMSSLLFQIGQLCNEMSECLLPVFEKKGDIEEEKKSLTTTQVFKLIYKKFRTQIYAYPHVINKPDTSQNQIDLLRILINGFKEIKSDLRRLLDEHFWPQVNTFNKPLYEFISNDYDLINRPSLNDEPISDFEKGMVSKLELLMVNLNAVIDYKMQTSYKRKEQTSDRPLTKEDISKKKVEKFVKILNNTHLEIKNYNEIKKDELSEREYYTDAFKMSIVNMGYYYKILDLTNFLQIQIPNLNEIKPIIYEILLIRHKNAREMCSSSITDLNMRFIRELEELNENINEYLLDLMPVITNIEISSQNMDVIEADQNMDVVVNNFFRDQENINTIRNYYSDI